MTQENASLRPTDMTTEEVEPRPEAEAKGKAKGGKSKGKTSKPKVKAKAKGRIKDIKQTPAYKAVMTDARPHLDLLCDALRKHRTIDNRTFSKVKRTVMDALAIVSKERKDGLSRQRKAGKKDLEEARAKKAQDRIAKAQERLDALKQRAAKK